MQSKPGEAHICGGIASSSIAPLLQWSLLMLRLGRDRQLGRSTQGLLADSLAGCRFSGAGGLTPCPHSLVGSRRHTRSRSSQLAPHARTGVAAAQAGAARPRLGSSRLVTDPPPQRRVVPQSGRRLPPPKPRTSASQGPTHAQDSGTYHSTPLYSGQTLRVADSVQRRTKLRLVTLGFGTGDRKWSLNDRHIPNVRGVRVHVSTRYNRGEGPLTRNPSRLRFATFCIAVGSVQCRV